MLEVEVAYALPEKQKLVRLQVAEGTSVLDAALESGLEADFPGLDIRASKLGVFSKPVARPADQPVRDGDRIEIYRPLLIDPKAARAQRAEKA